MDPVRYMKVANDEDEDHRGGNCASCSVVRLGRSLFASEDDAKYWMTFRSV